MVSYVAKWPDENGYIDFSATENDTWRILYERQIETIKNRACDEFIQGVEELGLCSDRIPQISEVNESLQKTGWKMVAVSGTVGVDEFFKMLTRCEFPVANFIRVPEELDYLQQPDLFHEFFGHGPLLMNHIYADFMRWYGETAQKLTRPQQQIFSRLFWYTIEFGLLNSSSGLRIYGGGILSSHAETIFCLESKKPKRLPFDLETILSMSYDYQSIQESYFIIDGLDDLYHLRKNPALQALISGDLSGDQDSFLTC